MFKEGDLAYLLDQKGKRHWLTIENAMIKVPGLGTMDGSRLVGTSSGSMLKLAGRRFWIMSPGRVELMGSMERGAQIITPKDAETILFHLDVKCGDLVIEGGVGSGSLTLALLSAVGREGRVISIEMREDFAGRARRNIDRTGMQERWSLVIGDVREMEIDEMANAMVLDIPDPWKAVLKARRLLRPGGRFCAYIPNMNQVVEVVRTLEREEFVEIYALENIQRRIEVHEGGVRPAFDALGHTGYMVFARSTTEQMESH